MLLMAEKRISHAIYRYTKANNKYMKDYAKNKDRLYGWKMSQKLPVNSFQQIKDTAHFNKDFIKNYNEESDK